MTFVPVLHFFTGVNSECSCFDGLCMKAEEISELSKTSKMELLWKIVKCLKTLTIFAIAFILDVWHGLNTPLKSICSGNT